MCVKSQRRGLVRIHSGRARVRCLIHSHPLTHPLSLASPHLLHQKNFLARESILSACVVCLLTFWALEDVGVSLVVVACKQYSLKE